MMKQENCKTIKLDQNEKLAKLRAGYIDCKFSKNCQVLKWAQGRTAIERDE